MNKPQFKLARVFADGTCRDVEIVPVTSLTVDVQMGRRGMLGTGLAVSSILSTLASCGNKRTTAQVPQAPSPREGTSGPLKGHKSAVTGLSLAPDGKTLLTGGLDEGIKTWSFPSGEYHSPFKSDGGNKNGFSAFLLTPDGQKLISEIHDPLSSEIEVRNFSNGNKVASLTGHTAPVRSLASSPDSSLLVSGSGDSTAKVWSLDQARLLATFQGHTAPVTALQISPDGEILYSASLDGSIRLWSLSQRRYLRTLSPIVPAILTLALSPNGRMLAAGSRDGSINVWNVPEGVLQHAGKPHSLAVNAVNFTSTGTTVFSGSEDGSIQRLSTRDWKYDTPILPGVGEITRVHQSPDGLWLIVGTVLGVLIFWDLISGTIRTYLFDRSISITTVRGVTYSSYDTTLGRTITYTLPCGTSLPANATCVCNCVGGEKPLPYVPPPQPTYQPPVSRPPRCSCVSNYQAPQQICTCNQVCTCVPQCICLAVPI